MGKTFAMTAFPDIVIELQPDYCNYCGSSLQDRSPIKRKYMQLADIQLNKIFIPSTRAFTKFVIVPRKHYQYIGQLNLEEEQAFAEIIKKLCVKYDNIFETSFPYSLGIHQQPQMGKCITNGIFKCLFIRRYCVQKPSRNLWLNTNYSKVRKGTSRRNRLLKGVDANQLLSFDTSLF